MAEPEMESNMEDNSRTRKNQNATSNKIQNEELGRGKRKKWPSKRLENFVTNFVEEEDYMVYALNAEEFVDDVPKNYEEIKGREDKEVWEEAIQEEITSLIENKTWNLMPLPAGKKAIDNKWMFYIKNWI